MAASSLGQVATVAATLLAPLVCAQSLSVKGIVLDTVAPAVVNVSTATNASTAYFPFEAQQLTDAVLSNLTAVNLTSSDLFAFADATNSPVVKRSGLCRLLPGDQLYPSTAVWDVLGLLLGPDVLIKTVPLASPCYTSWDNEDEEHCSFITNNWSNDSYMHADDPTSVMWPLYQGRTCMSATYGSENCTLGGYPSYAVAVSSVAHVQLTVNFARNTNLRLVVKNTGHDFNGKSAGAGALSVWTHGLKQAAFYGSLHQDGYTGPAIKVGTGIQAFELYEFAQAHNVTVVGGEGKTVGVAGGYMLGGGHSPLSSIYGMASDQLLAMEVVLPDGRFITASNSSHPDLFWALRGGGGSTFGIVTSLTVKAYPRLQVAVATFSFIGGGGSATNISTDVFWQGVTAYLARLPSFVDAGCYEYFSVSLTATDSLAFKMAPFFAPSHTTASLAALIEPLLVDLDRLGIDVRSGLTYYACDNFYDAWDLHFPLETVGITFVKTASRLFPRENFEPLTGNATLFNDTVAAFRSTISDGGALLAFNIGANPPAGYPDSAVNPAWRKTVMHAILGASWSPTADIDTIAAACLKLTNDWMQRWRDVSPTAGAYMSEADILEPNFQQAFYGTDHYVRLYALKQALDPWGLFYAPTGVGSENWYITGQIEGLPTQNGRLSRLDARLAL
ncbi:FAD-binding domain containing protein [Grosmannia clavigera kw1407]|uniref:FAD-binding domain containing protein n=1 Tax=Grosmannia clavigera (strain kw1407 / UAMH 11150) TaxID=655863 RepID=F0XC37_GROCL|nr:FAD-binding domain containing protein [Grosmannia clavigera kw1407]EFX03801.1 FAD-binding domain containing protein [Grosmannia clavigera kw1407]